MQNECQTQEVLARSPEPEAHDKVLDNNPERWKLSSGQFVVGRFESHPTCVKAFVTLIVGRR